MSGRLEVCITCARVVLRESLHVCGPMSLENRVLFMSKPLGSGGVDGLGLGIRCEAFLREAGVAYVDQLASLTDSDLLKLDGIGRRSIADIRAALRLRVPVELTADDWVGAA